MDQSSSGFEVGDCWASSSTNSKHSWLKIAVLYVQASLSGFGLPFSELYELHTIVVFANLEAIHFHVLTFLPAAEAKCWVSSHHIVFTNDSVLPNLLSFHSTSSSSFVKFLAFLGGAYLHRPLVVLSPFPPRPASTSGIPDLLRLTMDTAYLSNVCRGQQS